MVAPLSRRAVLAGAATLPLLPALAVAQGIPPVQREAERRFTALEPTTGGRLGVSVLDTATGRRLAYRADERFPMTSTFKFLLGAAVLRRADRGEIDVDRLVRYEQSDLLEYAPVTRERIERGMTIQALNAASIEFSDNTAANLLLREIGGPEGLTRFARSINDGITRLDRFEPELNSALADDPRDTTSPNAMVRDLNTILLGDALKDDSRKRLEGWMTASKTGLRRLRAGLPAGWVVGDKTGSGANGTANIVAIMRPPLRKPILAAVYLTGATVPPAERDEVHAQVARTILELI